MIPHVVLVAGYQKKALFPQEDPIISAGTSAMATTCISMGTFCNQSIGRLVLWTDRSIGIEG